MTPLLLCMAITDVHAAPIEIASATAKSSYDAGGSSYPASNLTDGKSKPWFEGDSGSGVGAWVQLDLGGEKNVTKIEMMAGDWTSGGQWQRANRPKELEITWSDGSQDMWTLDDEWTMQSFVPSGGKRASTIKFKLNSIHNGTAFPDTAISEIRVFDDSPGTIAPVKMAAASTEFPSDNDGSYFAHQVFDGVRDTYWCEGAKDNDGVGEWVELTFANATSIQGMSICSGMCASMDVHKKGNSPTKATLMFSDGSSEQIDLKAFPLPQKVKFSPRTVTSVKVKVDAVRKGSDYDDACISEVSFLR